MKAGEQIYSEVEFKLGKMYLLGQGILVDEAWTLRWFGYAIENDVNGWGDIVRAYIYILGVGVPKDTMVAFE